MNQEKLYNLPALFKLVLGEFTESTDDGLTVFTGDDDCRFACCMIQAVVKAIDRSEDVQRFINRTGAMWPVSINRCDTIDNLKGVLMALGNKLVTDYNIDPMADYGPINVTRFTEWLNASRPAREALLELGYDWPIVEREVVFEDEMGL